MSDTTNTNTNININANTNIASNAYTDCNADNANSDTQFYTTITVDNEGQRIDKYLSDMLEGISRSYIQKIIKDGNITVNQKTAKPNYKLAVNDLLSVTIPAPKKPDILPENIQLNIVHEDDDIIIVNKPKGMVVHPAPGHYSGTLVNALLYHCGDNLSGINGILRPGIVHRIDKDTTGLLVVCKNDRAHNIIAGQLAVHSITRTYHAIASGRITNDSGTINKPIGRDSTDRKKMAVTPNGRESITHYSVIGRYAIPGKHDYFTHIKCNLETGRTHQIRVHMSSIHHPLLGDTVYGPARQAFKTEGQVLHAKTIGFVHPSTNEYVEFDSELPQYFTDIINRLV